jgi:hypothetical protein
VCVRVCVCMRALEYLCVCVRARLCVLSLAFRVRGERDTVFGKGGFGSFGLGFGRQTVFGIRERQTVDLGSVRGFGFIESEDQTLETRCLSVVKPAAEPPS